MKVLKILPQYVFIFFTNSKNPSASVPEAASHSEASEQVWSCHVNILGVSERGKCEALIHGGDITISMPMRDSPGPGGCSFSKGLDLRLITMKSTNKVMGKVAKPGLNWNLLGIRWQLLAGMKVRDLNRVSLDSGGQMWTIGGPYPMGLGSAARRDLKSHFESGA